MVGFGARSDLAMYMRREVEIEEDDIVATGTSFDDSMNAYLAPFVVSVRGEQLINMVNDGGVIRDVSWKNVVSDSFVDLSTPVTDAERGPLHLTNYFGNEDEIESQSDVNYNVFIKGNCKDGNMEEAFEVCDHVSSNGLSDGELVRKIIEEAYVLLLRGCRPSFMNVDHRPPPQIEEVPPPLALKWRRHGASMPPPLLTLACNHFLKGFCCGGG
ncbi:hypothetical protein QYF36_009607 [Acer negundo]|nr:hypothetical protein QYF36_009607 [Acer negundo]